MAATCMWTWYISYVWYGCDMRDMDVIWRDVMRMEYMMLVWYECGICDVNVICCDLNVMLYESDVTWYQCDAGVIWCNLRDVDERYHNLISKYIPWTFPIFLIFATLQKYLLSCYIHMTKISHLHHEYHKYHTHITSPLRHMPCIWHYTLLTPYHTKSHHITSTSRTSQPCV